MVPFSCSCSPSCSDLNNNRAPSDPDSKPAIPELGVLPPMFKTDETHSRAVVRKCVGDLESKQRELESAIILYSWFCLQTMHLMCSKSIINSDMHVSIHTFRYYSDFCILFSIHSRITMTLKTCFHEQSSHSGFRVTASGLNSCMTSWFSSSRHTVISYVQPQSDLPQYLQEKPHFNLWYSWQTESLFSLPMEMYLTSLPLWQQAAHPVVLRSNPLPTGQWAVSSDTI